MSYFLIKYAICRIQYTTGRVYITHDWSDSFRFGTTYLAKIRENSARCCTEVYPWQLDRLIRRIEGINWECVWCTKFYTVHTFTFHVESQFICYKMIRFLLLGMAVKLTHFARDVKIITRTPGVSFTGVLAINNGPHGKLFEGVTLEVLHCPPTASVPCIWDIRQIVKSARDIIQRLNCGFWNLKRVNRISIKICEEFLEWWILTFTASSITDFPHWCPTERHLTPGAYSDPYNELHVEAPPESGTFLRLQVYKRVGILKRPKRANKFL